MITEKLVIFLPFAPKRYGRKAWQRKTLSNDTGSLVLAKAAIPHEGGIAAIHLDRPRYFFM
jgi:hypothetical protein